MPEPKKSYAPGRKARDALTTGAAAGSRRRMSAGRKLWYGLVVALIKALLFCLWKTCRVKAVTGRQHLDALEAKGEPVVFCYWHQMHVFCSRLMLELMGSKLTIGFLISPSVSGEVPTAIARSWGAEVVRGSPTRTGGQALRDMYLAISKQQISPVITVDGPKGPAEEVKVGAVLLARLSRAPMLPVAYAASPVKYWNSWDRFMLPAPFARIAYAIGEPIYVPPGTPIDDLEPYRLQLEEQLKALSAQARNALKA
jgi:lysophospholipid acyltransferase (LPLAT)-like uncharacterized protein